MALRPRHTFRALGRALGCAAGVVLATPAIAQPRQDLDSIVTLQVENDGVSTRSGTSDRYYTSGLRLGYTSGTDAIPEFLANFGRAVWGDGVQRISLDVAQSIFTPGNTQLQRPDPRDRPYAGYLSAGLSLIHDTSSVRSVLGLRVGVVGPSALGRVVQNGFHSIVGDPPVRGWSNQLQDEPVIELLAERIYRVPFARAGGIEFDALPALTLGVGTVRDYVQAGVQVRFGQGLDSDFGAARMRPARSGSDAYTATRPFAWYVFAGADGQAVARDVFLDGSTFRNRTPSVSKKVLQGEFQAGVAVMAYGLRVSYTQTWRTEEFRTQRAGLFSYGSLAVSAKF